MNRGDGKQLWKCVTEAGYFTAEYRETRCILQTSECQFKNIIDEWFCHWYQLTADSGMYNPADTTKLQH